MIEENKTTTSDELPDRLCVDPKSPYYNEAVLARDVGIRFKGVERTMSRNIASARDGFASPPATPRIATAIP